MSKSKDCKNFAAALESSNKKNEGVLSVNMSFEGYLIKSSKQNGTYASDWMDAEIKKSSSYFKKEIFSEE